MATNPIHLTGYRAGHRGRLIPTLFPVLILVAVLVACSGNQTPLDPKGPDAELVSELWWWMLGIAAAVFAAVMLLLGAALRNGRRKAGQGPNGGVRRWVMVVGGGVVLPFVTIVALVVFSLLIGRDMAADRQEAAVDIEIIGKQWWWEVRYLDKAGNRIATTANEIHIPVGRSIRFLLKSDNVIHSFWVPNLQGKTDMIPGRINETRLLASKAGTYRGQCSEFCGTQHALMAFLVVAEEPDRFQAWLDRQGSPSVLSGDPAFDQGRRAFQQLGCAGCHAIRGSPARGVLGPDLTHIAGRETLAAGTLENTRENLAGWIADSQRVKPGNLMPAVPLSGKQKENLLDYLESLK